MSPELYTLLPVLFAAGMAVFLILWLRSRRRLRQALRTSAGLERRNTFLASEVTLLRKQLAQMKLVSLKSQVNPHFVFNCLNGIHSAVITAEYNRAKEYIAGFGRLLRMVLMLSGKHLISLREESELLEHYLKLEKLRTNNAFDYTFHTDPGIDQHSTLIPGMLVQPFLENAIWHGLMAKDGDKHLHISWKILDNNLLQCQVEDNGIGRNLASLRCNVDLKAGASHQSKGMDLCLERIELYRSAFQARCNIEIEDLTDDTNMPEGTRVLLTFEVNPEMIAVMEESNS